MTNRARYSPDRDTNALCLEAVRAGWVVDKTGSGHLLFTAPSGAFCSASSTPSDWRAIHKARAKLDRAWPGWDGRVRGGPPKQREKRPGRKACEKVPWTWDGSRGVSEPMTATLADLWPKEDASA